MRKNILLAFTYFTFTTLLLQLLWPLENSFELQCALECTMKMNSDTADDKDSKPVNETFTETQK